MVLSWAGRWCAASGSPQSRITLTTAAHVMGATCATRQRCGRREIADDEDEGFTFDTTLEEADA
ncbi:hypothetical protein [Mycobacterium sp.]|uniref:hypothetical protein n=1 Tax=Mycobacterium sp. TaxID=1785 RepID=UPI0031DC0136